MKAYKNTITTTMKIKSKKMKISNIKNVLSQKLFKKFL